MNLQKDSHLNLQKDSNLNHSDESFTELTESDSFTELQVIITLNWCQSQNKAIFVYLKLVNL